MEYSGGDAEIGTVIISRTPQTSALRLKMNPNSQKNVLPEVLTTIEAAAAINRQPQTLRKWACLDNGPIRPVRIHGRLAWRVTDLQKLISGEVV